MRRLEGKVAMVTGSGGERGFGRAIARKFASEGADLLVNNAAAPPGADRVPVVELEEDAWRTVLETNLTGTYLCSRAVAGLMVRRGMTGRIINMSSNCGKVG